MIPPAPARSLPWIQLALEDQDRVPLKSQINVAARRVDVLVGDGLRAAVQPEEDGETVALHAALRIGEASTGTQRDDLIARLADAGSAIEYAVVNRDWLAARRRHRWSEIGAPTDLVDRFHRFLLEALDELKDADVDELL